MFARKGEWVEMNGEEQEGQLSLTCPARWCTRRKRGPRTVPDRGTGTCTVGQAACKPRPGEDGAKSYHNIHLTSSARPVFLSRDALGPCSSARNDPGTPLNTRGSSSLFSECRVPVLSFLVFPGPRTHSAWASATTRGAAIRAQNTLSQCALPVAPLCRRYTQWA